MAYTTINKSTDYFNTKLYTGNGGTNAITAMKFFAYDYTGGGSHGNVTGEIRMYGLKGS